MATSSTAVQYGVETKGVASGAVVLLGRIFFSLVFITAGLNHFSPQTIAYAASAGVPMASILVPFSGVMALIGGLSILLGYRGRIGAWVIVLFLIPITLTMHNFWAVHDVALAQDQMAHFFKNVSMLGGALLISQLGTGPYSLDARRSR